MDKTQFESIMAKLDQISNLLAFGIVKDLGNQKKQIIELSRFGFRPKEICSFLGAKRSYVDNTLSAYRKEQTKKKPEKKKD
jgi:hypothetical protein